MNKSVTALQKDVKELLNPLAIRYKGITITPVGFADAGAVGGVTTTPTLRMSTPFGNIPLDGRTQHLIR